MIPLITAIEDLDSVLPQDVRIAWNDAGSEGRYALTLENERVSVRLQVESDALIQRGESYRQFLACVAKVIAAMMPPVDVPAAGDHRLVA